jgi:prolyl-tRNA editing enzyme YbaK/EbsC (Cys-tRNA(Pro) deacylase)
MWPESVQRVAAFLHEARAEAILEEFAEGTTTAEDAARAVGADVSQIVKSLVFVSDDGRPVLALVPGDRRADAEKVARAVGAGAARVGSRKEVESATGVAPGSVAPFPLPKIEHVLIDRTLLSHEYVWVGAGSPNHIARLRPAELTRLARARQMDVVDERAYDSD